MYFVNLVPKLRRYVVLGTSNTWFHFVLCLQRRVRQSYSYERFPVAIHCDAKLQQFVAWAYHEHKVNIIVKIIQC